MKVEQILAGFPEPCRANCEKAAKAAAAFIDFAKDRGLSDEETFDVFSQKIDQTCEGLKRPPVCGRDIDCGDPRGPGHWWGMVLDPSRVIE